MPTCGSYYYYLRKSKKVAKCVIDSIRHLKWAKKNIFPVEVPVVTGGGGRFRMGSLFTDMRERILLKKERTTGKLFYL